VLFSVQTPRILDVRLQDSGDCWPRKAAKAKRLV